MNLRWLLLDYADPVLPLTQRERWRLRRKAFDVMQGQKRLPKASRRKQPAALLVASALVPSVCSFTPLVIWMIVSPKWLPGAVIAVCCSIMCSWVGTAYLGRFTWRPYVNIALREMGHDVCEACGYWLRGLDGGVTRCPECGANREPARVIAAPP